MKVIVAYSGGKDSHASLIWAVNKYGKNNVEAVFCDTGWEHDVTYDHIFDTASELGVILTIVRSRKYKSLPDLAEKKKRFPSSQARFCTSELKSIPFIDYVLSKKEHLLIIQGIRAEESHSRSLMKAQCRYFKYYFEPYSFTKDGKPKFHTYRKKDVAEWVAMYSDDVERPVFDWSAQQVIDYIISNGQQPNPLYKEGFKRVGCFPCILSGQREVFEIINRYPERFEEILSHEKRIGSSFFKIDFVPEYSRSGICNRTGKKYTTGEDVRKYLLEKNATLSIFPEDKAIKCSSYYHLCE